MILDWVPAHFPRDEWALAPLRRHARCTSTRTRAAALHPDWGTLVFNFGRNEVRNFLIASALFWLERVPRRRAARRRGRLDALPRLLAQGGRVGRQRATAAARTSRRSPSCASSTRCSTRREPGVMLGGRGVDGVAGRLAADLPRRARLRLQVEHGLDARHARLLRSSDPVYRRYHHHELTFSLLYAFSENFILPLSHDEVVHGKGSLLLARCPATAGSSSRTCARCTPTCGRTRARSCCSWAASSPRSAEWSHERSLDWHLLEYPEHAGVQPLVRDLNRVYRERAGAVGAGPRPRRLLVARAERCRRQHPVLRAASRDNGDLPGLRVQLQPGADARPIASACRCRAAGGGAQHRLGATTAAATSATSAA